MVFWTENRPQNIDILTLARLANFNLDSFPKKQQHILMGGSLFGTF